jgi:uncharacterized RDD family membrane protein YckC
MPRTLDIPSVTGVDLKLEIAGPGGRSYAFVIDWHIRLLAALAWFLVGGLAVAGGFNIAEAATTSPSTFVFVVVLPATAIYLLYHPVLEILMQGRTPGKRMAGVRIVTLEGATPGIGALLIRNVFRLVDSLPIAYCVGLAATMLTQQAVRLGDLAAGTLLVYDEPEKLAALGALSAAAIGTLGLEQTELVRDLLARWDELDVDVRGRLARQLLASLGREPAEHDDAVLRQALEVLIG